MNENENDEDQNDDTSGHWIKPRSVVDVDPADIDVVYDTTGHLGRVRDPGTDPERLGSAEYPKPSSEQSDADPTTEQG